MLGGRTGQTGGNFVRGRRARRAERALEKENEGVPVRPYSGLKRGQVVLASGWHFLHRNEAAGFNERHCTRPRQRGNGCVRPQSESG